MPFLVDANCNPIYLNKSYTPTWSERKYFLQVECLKKQIIDFNNFIKSKNRPYLLIIASDTGWTFDDKIHPSLNPKALWPKSHFQNITSVQDGIRSLFSDVNTKYGGYFNFMLKQDDNNTGRIGVTDGYYMNPTEKNEELLSEDNTNDWLKWHK